MNEHPRVLINHANLSHNLAVLSTHAESAAIMLAVKTNAYGHGLVEVSRTAIRSGVAGLATLEVGAAARLRESRITERLFAWLFSDDEIPEALEHGIDLGVSRLEQLEAIGRAASKNHVANVHLKFDSGLTRNGAQEEEWPDFCARAYAIQKSGSLNVVGIWTHLADASRQDDVESLNKFDKAVRVARASGLTPQFLHAGASSFGLQQARERYDFVRFGIAAYGISPFDDRTATSLGLRPVMTLTAPVISVDKESITIAAGYGHGVLTGDHPDRCVLINERHHTVVNIGVDRMRVTSSSDVKVGDTAVIFGEGGPSAEQLGTWCNTIGDEVVTSVSTAIPREHLNFVAWT